MTVPSEVSRIEYSGNDVADTFSFPFRVDTSDDLRVTHRDDVGDESVYTHLTDYTISGLEDEGGGSITLTAGALPTGERIVIERVPDQKQELDVTSRSLKPRQMEDALDKLTFMVQALQDELDRCVKSRTTDWTFDPNLPKLTSGYYPRVKDDGTGWTFGLPIDGATVTVLDEDDMASDSATAVASQQSIKAYIVNRSAISVTDYGAVGNGITNDTAAIQSAIDAAGGSGSGPGGVVFFPPGEYLCSGLILRGHVTITTLATQRGYLASSPFYTARLKHDGLSEWLIDTPSGAAGQVGLTHGSVWGLDFSGDGSNSANQGIRCQSGNINISRCTFDNFSRRAVLFDTNSLACLIEDCLVTRPFQIKDLADRVGAVEVLGTDHWVRRCEIAAGLTAHVSGGSLWYCAIVVKAAACFLEDAVGEFGEVGIYTEAANAFRCVGSRGDRNVGHGFYIASSGGTFSSCTALENSYNNTGNYDGFYVTGFNNTFAACSSRGVSGGFEHRYGYNDTVANQDTNFKNTYYGCVAEYYTTAKVNLASYGSSFMVPYGVRRPTANLTTIDVNGSERIWLNLYTTPTTVTDFTNGVSGQAIEVVGNSNVTIQYGFFLRTPTGANFTLADDVIYRWVKFNGIWYFAGTSRPTGLWGKGPSAQPASANQASVTLVNSDGAIGGLTISAAYDQAEVQALRDACETLADDVRAMHTLLESLRTAGVDVGAWKGSA